MKDVSCVDQLSFVKPVTNFQAVALDTPVVVRLQRKLKYMKDVSNVDQLSCQTCNKCPSYCSISTCRGKTAKLLENLGSSGCRSESTKHSQAWLHPPLLDPAELDKATDHHKLLCQSSKKPLSVGGITSAYEQTCSGTNSKSKISGVLQPTFLGPKAKQLWRPILDLSKLNLSLMMEKFKMETPETIGMSLQQWEWLPQ